MTTYLDNALITMTRGLNFRVELEEENATIMVARDIVERITQTVGDDEEPFIILILAYIDYVRRDRNGVDKKAPNRIDEDKIVDVFSIIYNQVDSIESLSEIFRNLKWHEIKEIIESEDPMVVLNEYL